MEKPVKVSTALAIFRATKVLVVRRPNVPGEELPGLWGLPAASHRRGETLEQRTQRIAQEKLGIQAHVEGLLARGRQERDSYILDMDLYQASSISSPRLPPRMTGAPGPDSSDDGTTYYIDWQWAPPEVLIPAAKQGSLCARLLLEATDRWSRKAS